MLTGLIVLLSLAAYFAVGVLLAVRDIPNAWDRARRGWQFHETQRSSARMQTFCTALAWPVLVPLRYVTTRLGQIVDERDPETLRAQLNDRERVIADLERELGVGTDRRPR